MHITNISDAKASLSSLIKQVQETRQPIIIGKAGNPVAVLSAYTEDTSPRTLGGNWKGKIKIAEDFNEPCEETLDSFYNSSLFPDKK